MKKCIKRYELKLHKDGMKKGRCRIAFLSDLHNCSWGRENDTVLKVLKLEKPDLVLCGGDMITAYPGEPMDTGLSLINSLSEKYPVYLGVGNHELRLRLYPDVYGDMYERYLNAVSETKAVILSDCQDKISVSGLELDIYGLDIPRHLYNRFKNYSMGEGYLCSMLGKPDPKRIAVLMAHHPKYLKTYLGWGADLVLCGHCHGGIVGLSENRGFISPDFRFLKSYTRGSCSTDGRLAVISSGMGEHTVPVRISNPEELDIIDIINE